MTALNDRLARAKISRATIAALLMFAGFVATASAQAPAAKAGDAKTGATKASMCIGCHGIPDYRASFPEVHRVPMLAGQNAPYLASALHEYKKGERKHPTMRAIATSLTEQDIADLAAFYSTEAKDVTPVPATLEREPSTRVADLLKKANCAACHGANFDKPIDPTYPKISGQHADYLYVALKAYQTDHNPQVGREHPVMSGMARMYTHEELKALANYIGSLPGELQTVPQSRFR